MCVCVHRNVVPMFIGDKLQMPMIACLYACMYVCYSANVYSANVYRRQAADACYACMLVCVYVCMLHTLYAYMHICIYININVASYIPIFVSAFPCINSYVLPFRGLLTSINPFATVWFLLNRSQPSGSFLTVRNRLVPS